MATFYRMSVLAGVNARSFMELVSIAKTGMWGLWFDSGSSIEAIEAIDYTLLEQSDAA